MTRGDDDSIERTAGRYLRTARKRSTYYYVVSKLRRDPATRAIGELGPLGDVLDLGCGRGHLAVYLLERGLARSVRAVDWDAEKVEVARRAGEGLDASFDAADVRDGPTEPADTVLLIDVLHYLDAGAQDRLLARAASLVRPGGRLIVREATAGRGWRSAFTWLVEWISVLIRFNVGDRVALRNVSTELVPQLTEQGLECSVSSCWGGTPFANVLLVASRPPALPRAASA